MYTIWIASFNFRCQNWSEVPTLDGWNKRNFNLGDKTFVIEWFAGKNCIIYGANLVLPRRVSACVGHCLVILKCSCSNHSSKTCSSPVKTQAQILELRSRSPKSVVNDSKNYNSLLFPIAETHPPYTTDGQYNIFLQKIWIRVTKKISKT